MPIRKARKHKYLPTFHAINHSCSEKGIVLRYANDRRDYTEMKNNTSLYNLTESDTADSLLSETRKLND